MEKVTSLKKKLKSPGIDGPSKINFRTSVTCVNVPDGLFEASAATKHFGKFGKVQKIKLCPKRQLCIVEYDQPISAERAVLNAGAYDGFMFEVSRTKARVRRRSKREDDPDWVPDSDVEDELSAMSGAPTHRVSRQKAMELDSPKSTAVKILKKPMKLPLRVKPPIRDKRPIVAQPTSGIESSVVVPTQTSMSTSEAAAELHQLRSRVSLTPDEQWRTLDARDRILRAWGGAGSRVKVGGATIGTCPDMCPEKELLHRQAEHQTMTLETVPESDGMMEAWRAVKQYSRSSADQEIPMCYELRPAGVLLRTCSYLLHEIADTTRQVTLADWFHFMWDRLRGIRKDITQQALCCADSIRLVEMCARFHAHCAARLADLEHTQFDQKLNTDNLTKCLQTLKHMYADVGPDLKPWEAEFRGYIALLNLGDANFWWEIKQLPVEIQKSTPITFAIKVFNALDNNNYVRFFRLVREEATYLQACILLRYFNDVRARALARIVRAYAARGGSKYPAEDIMKILSFESIENMKSFIMHYGLRLARDESELAIILNRNQFIEDSDPFPVARAVKLIESKRQCTVGEVIAGGSLPYYERNLTLYTSFNKDGKLKEAALIAEEQGYNTLHDSNKDVRALKTEIQRLAQGGRSFVATEKPPESKSTLFAKPDTRSLSPGKSINVFSVPVNDTGFNKSFSFKPAIPVAPADIIKKSPEKVFAAENKTIFSFSKPQDTGETNNIFLKKDPASVFKATTGGSLFTPKTIQDDALFGKTNNENKDHFTNSQNLFKKPNDTNIFKTPDTGKSVFQRLGETNNGDINKNVFPNPAIQNSFGTKSIFGKVKTDESSAVDAKTNNIFANEINAQSSESKNPADVFGSFNRPNLFNNANNVFAKPEHFTSNGDVSPGSLFKSANTAEGTTYSIFQSKNKAPVAENIFNSVNSKNNIYEFNENKEEEKLKQQKLEEEKVKEMERKIEEQMKREEDEKRREQQRQEEQRRNEEEQRKEEEKRKQEELRKLEERRRKEEERKQEELRKRLEEERRAELKRKAEEEERNFKQRVETESNALIEEILNEVRDETVKNVLVEELDKMKKMMSYAADVTDQVWIELCDEITHAELMAEKFWTDKLKKKWFHVWRKQFQRNYKRRCLLEDTPVWLTDRTPVEEAARLRRLVENATLKNMNAIHRGYKFTGELRPLPSPEPYNIMEIIRSPLLKRMRQINYPYDKCFFWKVTIISPGPSQWISRKIEIGKWILDAFSDKTIHDISETLIRVEKQSWNHLMDFAISVSMTNADKKSSCSEAMEGTNGLLFYTSENDYELTKTIEETIHQKYPYQVVPVTVIMPNTDDPSKSCSIQQVLSNFAEKGFISGYKIFTLDHKNIFESLYATTKTALKWMAKKCPQPPSLEIDSLKSICERYLGNDIWHRLRSEQDGRMISIRKDMYKLVECYNVAVNKLTELITNEDLFNYAPFPLEFKDHLNHALPHPLPYEFIPTNVRNSNNTSAIRDTMASLMLPDPSTEFHPIDTVGMQGQIRKYCNQIGWFEDPEKVVCKVVAKLPTQFSDVDMPSEQFINCFENYDLIDFLNILVYEKISKLRNFDRYAIYKKSDLQEYSNMDWLYETKILSRMKHKALDYEDELHVAIEAKRRKIAMDSIECLALEESDCTMVEDNIKAANDSISQYGNCKEAVKQLEEQIEIERKKSMEFENFLKSALAKV